MPNKTENEKVKFPLTFTIIIIIAMFVVLVIIPNKPITDSFLISKKFEGHENIINFQNELGTFYELKFPRSLKFAISDKRTQGYSSYEIHPYTNYRKIYKKESNGDIYLQKLFFYINSYTSKEKVNLEKEVKRIIDKVISKNVEWTIYINEEYFSDKKQIINIDFKDDDKIMIVIQINNQYNQHITFKGNTLSFSIERSYDEDSQNLISNRLN